MILSSHTHKHTPPSCTHLYCTCPHAAMHAHTLTNTHTHTHTHTHTRTHAHTTLHCIHKHVHYTHACILHTYTSSHTHKYHYIHARMHIHTHSKMVRSLKVLVQVSSQSIQKCHTLQGHQLTTMSIKK